MTTIFGKSFTTTGVLGASRDESGQIAERGFPSWITIPSYQDLATGRRWHFFFAWLLVLNGAVYVANLFARRHLKDFLPSSRRIALDSRIRSGSMRACVFRRATRRCITTCCRSSPISRSSSRCRFSCWPGLTMSPAIDAAFPWLLALFGGRQSARTIHFIAAFYLVGFLFVHVVMVLVSGFFNNMISMITGRYAIEEERHEA